MKHVFRIIKTTSSLWRYYVIVSFTSVTIAILGLLLPLLTGRAIDEIGKGGEGDVSLALWLAFGVFAVDLGSTLISNFGGYYGDQIQVRLQKKLSDQYFAHLLKLPQNYFDTELSGKIVNRLNRSISQISGYMQMMSNTFLQFIFSTVFALVVIAFISWPVALLLSLLYPVYMYMTVRTSSKWLVYQEEKNLNSDIASGRFTEAISQMKVVKSFNQERREFDFFTRHLKRVTEVNRPQSVYWHKQDIKRRAILNVIFFGVYAYIFSQGVSGAISTGQAVALILYAAQIRIPIFTISFLVEQTQRAVADSKDYFEVLDEKPHTKANDHAPNLEVRKGEIEFKDVAFAYDEKGHVLTDINLRLKPNETVALVGESGGGKTTITNLLMRLYELNKGQITIDGTPITDVSLKSLRDSIGVVFQDPSLFSGTIRENIAYSTQDASQEQIEAAAKAANAHEFITKLEDGYDSEIGERGLKLSGGQKQRIAIARAILKDAPILILDEATSSLDSKSERLVQEALDKLMKGRTTIIIAHRLSTIAKVNTIVTIVDGTIGEMGSPSELAQSDGVYANLLKLQQSGSTHDRKQLQKFDIAAK